MSRTIEHAPAVAAAPPGAPAAVAVVARRPRPWSSAAATERQWLEEGFDPPAPDLEDFLAQAPPSALRNTHRIAIGLFLSMVALASVLKVDIIVAGSGRLAADAPTIVLQPMQLSVIRQIRVKPGDAVREGDVLAALDPTFAQADRAVLLAQQSGFRAQQARLDAELAGTAFDAEPASPERTLQQTLFRQRRAQFDTRAADFAQRLESYAAEVAAAEQTRASLVQQLGLAREMEGMRSTLFKSQSGSKLNYMEAQATRMRTERDLQAAISHLNTVQQTMRSTQAEHQAYVDTWRRELLEALVKTRTEMMAVDEALTKANRMNELVVLKAPADGVVLEVAKRSVGSVLNAAEPLITMIPLGAALIAEISVSSGDVGYTKAGDPVALKVDAFPYQRHGLLTGRLRSIGADSYGSGGAAGATLYHRVQVELGETTLRAMPEGAALIPGMTLTGEVKVGTRSVISYLLYPITRGFSESIREP